MCPDSGGFVCWAYTLFADADAVVANTPERSTCTLKTPPHEDVRNPDKEMLLM